MLFWSQNLSNQNKHSALNLHPHLELENYTLGPDNCKVTLAVIIIILWRSEKDQHKVIFYSINQDHCPVHVFKVWSNNPLLYFSKCSYFCLIPAVEISFSFECHGGALCSGLYYCCLIEIVMGGKNWETKSSSSLVCLHEKSSSHRWDI